MNAKAVQIAKREALRFLEAVKDVEVAAETDRMIFYGSRPTGALRRSSMDLTRALADLRR